MYKINISIFNDFGELAVKQLIFSTLDEMLVSMEGCATMYKIVEEAKKYATENNMVVEDTIEYDGSSRIDIINSDEKFQ